METTAPPPSADAPQRRGYFAILSLAALGVVYGDIGTSPLYAMRESFSGHFGVDPLRANVLGVLSLITWSLILIVCVKYLWLVLRADNDGEGGILALTALVDPRMSPPGGIGPRRRHRLPLILTGIFGGALLFGDGIITPAISVLSSVEGLEVAAPALAPYVLPMAVAILVGLFLIQRFGTHRVGAVFGPIMLVWFVTLSVLGVRGILMEPAVLQALDPRHALAFLGSGHLESFLVLGAVFLVVTGVESLYADMGHFGRGPIRMAWFALVLPALLLNYYGQGGLILAQPQAIQAPFFLLAPPWARLPLVGLAALAAVIASQALISGIFSITRQAVQLGFWPRTEIRHTSATEYGQIYVPAANWSLMISTILLVLAFRSSSALTAAYGIAIICTMLVTTILLFVVAPERWGWNPWVARAILTFFLAIELGFFLANVIKIHEGGWVPLLIAGAMFLLMTTWETGRNMMGRRIGGMLMPLKTFLKGLDKGSVVRVPGNAVYMTGNAEFTPPPLLKNMEHQKTLHERVILMTVTTERAPTVRGQRVKFVDLGQGFYQVLARYGFMENPDMRRILDLLRNQGLDLKLDDTTFFLGRERILSRIGGSPLKRARVALFSFMSRNSQRATAFFNIPADRVVEVGSQIEV